MCNVQAIAVVVAVVGAVWCSTFHLHSKSRNPNDVVTHRYKAVFKTTHRLKEAYGWVLWSQRYNISAAYPGDSTEGSITKGIVLSIIACVFLPHLGHIILDPHLLIYRRYFIADIINVVQCTVVLVQRSKVQTLNLRELE